LLMSQRVAGFGTTIFADINALAAKHRAVNLGQGAPDFDGPPAVLAAAVAAVNGALNQYAPGIGMPAVRQAIAQHAGRFYGQTLNPDTEVLVTTGATEGAFAAILGLTDPGDEVIVFEPVYDTYVPNLAMAGVTPRYVALRGDRWEFDPNELARAFNSRRIIPPAKFSLATNCSSSRRFVRSMMSSRLPMRCTSILSMTTHPTLGWRCCPGWQIVL